MDYEIDEDIINELVDNIASKYYVDYCDGIFEIVLRGSEDWDDEDSEFNATFPHEGSGKQVLAFFLNQVLDYAQTRIAINKTKQLIADLLIEACDQNIKESDKKQ